MASILWTRSSWTWILLMLWKVFCRAFIWKKNFNQSWSYNKTICLSSIAEMNITNNNTRLSACYLESTGYSSNSIISTTQTPFCWIWFQIAVFTFFTPLDLESTTKVWKRKLPLYSRTDALLGNHFLFQQVFSTGMSNLIPEKHKRQRLQSLDCDFASIQA